MTAVAEPIETAVASDAAATDLATPDVPAVRVTVKAADLEKLVKTALVFTSQDATLPMLGMVRFDVADGQLVAQSTDRFRIGMVRIPCEVENPGTFTALLDGASLKRLLPALKAPGRSRREPEISAELRHTSLNRVSVQVGAGEFAGGFTEFTLEDQVEVNFPKCAQLIPKNLGPIFAGESSDGARFMVTPKYLASFEKAAWSKSDSMVVEGEGTGRPITIRVGEHFLGLLMPVRAGIGNEGHTRDSWTSLIDTLKNPGT